MKITCNTEKTISKEYAMRIKQLVDGCAALRDQVTEIIFKHGYERYVENVYLRQIAGVPSVRIQLVFGEYNSVIYLQQEKQGVGKIQIHPPKFLSTEKLLDLGNYAEWMSWLATISGTIYREVVWNIPFGDSVESAQSDYVWVVYDEYGEYVCAYPADREGLAKQKAKELYKGRYQKEQLDSVESATEITADQHGVVYRVYEHTKDADHDEIRQVNAWAYDKQAIAWAKRHANTQTFLSVVKVTDTRTLGGKGNLDSEVIWKSWECPDAAPLQLNGGKTLTGDVTVKDLADLFRSAWETANLSWGNTAEDLLEWQDAFYCDTKYREGVADYAIANIPQLQEANMSDVHVIADEDENSSELLLTICIDGKPVDKIRTWYVHDRWDAFLDEL